MNCAETAELSRTAIMMSLLSINVFLVTWKLFPPKWLMKFILRAGYLDVLYN